MKTIKFSHDYFKLPTRWEDGEARLMSVWRIDLEKQDKQMLDEDTAICGGGNYPLPKKGEFILLFFEPLERNTDLIEGFTTIRRYTPQKWKYYCDAVGEDFVMKKVAQK